MNKVLIADDNAQITKVLKDYAGKEGWGSYIAYDGDEALRLFREFSKEISIVFLDVMMPKKDGFSVCKAIRAMSQVPVIDPRHVPGAGYHDYGPERGRG